MNGEQRAKIADKRRTDAATILLRLKQGPATAPELAAIVFSYRQRISDCRASGWIIECKRTSTGSVFVLKGHREAGQQSLALGAA